MRKMLMTTTMTVIIVASTVLAQTPARAPSPDSVASIQVGDWKAGDAPGARVANGKWIEVLYGRPILRGRTEMFGSAPAYGAALKGDKAVWRAGANVLTRFRTEAPLVFSGKPVGNFRGTDTVAPGEYTLFVDLKGPTDWTMILSSQPANAADDVPTRSKVWEAFVYVPDKDVVRVPMKVEALPYSMEQLTYLFTDVTGTSATLRLMWEKTMASVTFAVAR